MAEEDYREEGREEEDHLPGLSTFADWARITGILIGMVLINIMVAFASWGWGVVITIPFTALMFAMLVRDRIPRHRFPRGRQRPTGLAA